MVTIDQFMIRCCIAKIKKYRISRKQALLTAARHGTIAMPPQAQAHRQGHANKYFVQYMLNAWQRYITAGFELPQLLKEEAA